MVSLHETEDHPSVLWLWYMSTFRGLVCLSTLSSTILISSETGTIASIQSVSPQQKKNHSCKPRTGETLLLWQIVRRGVSGIMPRFGPPNVCTVWQQWRAKGNIHTNRQTEAAYNDGIHSCPMHHSWWWWCGMMPRPWVLIGMIAFVLSNSVFGLSQAFGSPLHRHFRAFSSLGGIGIGGLVGNETGRCKERGDIPVRDSIPTQRD